MTSLLCSLLLSEQSEPAEMPHSGASHAAEKVGSSRTVNMAFLKLALHSSN